MQLYIRRVAPLYILWEMSVCVGTRHIHIRYANCWDFFRIIRYGHTVFGFCFSALSHCLACLFNSHYKLCSLLMLSWLKHGFYTLIIHKVIECRVHYVYGWQRFYVKNFLRKIMKQKTMSKRRVEEMTTRRWDLGAGTEAVATSTTK